VSFFDVETDFIIIKNLFAGFSKLEFRPRPSILFNKAGIWVKVVSRENGPWRPTILLRRQLRLLRIIFPHKVIQSFVRKIEKTNILFRSDGR
jgi:hypothetical protein